MAQRGWSASVRWKQTWQWRTWSLASRIASASSRASSAGHLRRWWASRSAVLAPMPGRRPRAAISRSTAAGEAGHAQAPRPAARIRRRPSGNPGIGRPPASEASDWAAASRALVRPGLTAAVTRSSSSSASPSASSLGSIRTETTSSRPLTLAVTAPPPGGPLDLELAERLGRLLHRLAELAGVPHQVGEVSQLIEHGCLL